MKTISYVVKDPKGFHALPASKLIKLLSSYSCRIMAEGNGKSVDAKSVFGFMSLGVRQGHTLTITCDGADEEEASSVIERYLQDNL